MKKVIITAIFANALLVQTVSAVSVTWSYNFKTTPDGGVGTVAPVATLSLEDVTNINIEGQNVDGVKFTLSNLGTSIYADPASPGKTHISGLFLNASSESAFETEWKEVQLPGGDANMTRVEFGEEEHPNQYDYSIEVNFDKDLPENNALKNGESISWLFYNFQGGVAPAVSDFLFAGTDNPAPGPDASYPQDVWSTIKIRGVNPELGELVFRKETIHVVASADIDAFFNWAENEYPQYFPSHVASQNIDGYYARFYSATNIYLGTKDGRVYVYGDVFGGLLDVGELEGWLLSAQ